jgi:hypothetical protein
VAYVQADEVYTDDQRRLVAGWTRGALEFASCVNFWNGFDRVLANEFPMRYLRLLPADAHARPVGDGFTFETSAPVHTTEERFLHYGWSFPENILQKHVSHSRLYADSPAYRLRGAFARALLSRGLHDERLLDALAPHYRPVRYDGEHPSCVGHLIGMTVYDPWVGIGLLREGARW